MPDYKLRLIVEGSDAGASRALGGVNKSLDDLEKKAKSSAAGIGSSLKSMGNSLTSTGKSLSLAVTAPLVGIAAVALNSAAKFEQSMNLIQATTGATAAQMKAMQAEAIELGAKTVFSAGEAAQGLLELSKAGLSAEQSMQAISGVLDLAAAGNLSVASAAETTSNALNAFHLEATKANEIANMFAASANASSIEVSDMTQSFSMASAVFATYGQNIYDLSTGLAILGNNGIKGSDAGTSLKTMMSRLAAPTDTAKDLMNQLGVSVYDASGNMRQFPDIMQSVSKAMSGLNDESRNAAMYQIFGSDALRAASILLKEGQAGWDKMSAAVHKGGQAALLSDARMKGLAGAIEYWSGSVDSFLISAALPFQDFFSNILRNAADFLTSIGSMDEGTRKWAIGIGVAAAAAGPLLIVVGTLATTMGAAIPVLAAVGSALLPVGIGLGALYAAYRLNIGGLRTLINTGLNRLQKAAPLAGRAVHEFWAQMTGDGINVYDTTAGIQNFIATLTGSELAGMKVSNWVSTLGDKLHAARVAFTDAGGGLQGFVAGLGQLVGQKINLSFADNIVKLTWGDVFDFSGGFDPGDWSKGFVKLKIGDMVDFTQDWTSGITKLKIKDLIDFSTDGTKTSLSIKDLVEFTKDSEKTKLSIGDFFSFDTTAGKEKLKLGDWYELDKTTGTNKLKFGDWYEFDATTGKEKINIHNFYELDETTGKEKITFGDWYEWENGKEKIKVGDFYTLDETTGKEKIKFGNWYEFDTTGDKTTINIWDWYKLEETPTKKTIKLGDQIAFDSTKTTLKFGDWFDWDMSGINLNLKDLFPKKINIAELFDWGVTDADKLGFTGNLKVQGPNKSDFAVPPDFLAGAKWPELPKFEWPPIKITWPDLPTIVWPPTPEWVKSLTSWVASLPEWVTSLLGWTATTPDWATTLTSWVAALPDWVTTLTSWIPGEPAWLKSLLAWSPTVTISGTISSAVSGITGAVSDFLSGGVQGPPRPAKGDPEVTFNPQRKAMGTDNFSGGWTWVGERGPELLNLPPGSKIMSNQKSMGMIGKMAEGNTSGPYLGWQPAAMPRPIAPISDPQLAPKILTQMTASNNTLRDIDTQSKIGPNKIIDSQNKNATKLSQDIDGMFQKVPGLFHTSDVTQKQLDMAKLGIPQNFADDWLRHLTDEVVNGVKWDDADITDAATRAGIDPSLPAKAILEMVKDQWNTGEFFADPKNLDVVNTDAIKQSILEQQKQAAGQANLNQLSLLFGGTGGLTQQAQALGGQARTGLMQGLTGAGGGVGAAPVVDLSSILLGNAGTDITPESVAPLAQSFMAAIVSAFSGTKDAQGNAKAGTDFGSQIASAISTSVANSDALASTGKAVLQKITDSWKTISDVDFIGGIAAAMTIQIGTDNAINALKNVGGKIAKLIKDGIDEYFNDAALADSIKNSITTAPSVPAPATGLATGTSFWSGGLTWVGERGAELVNLPRGAQVFNNGQSMAMAGAGGGDTHNWYVTADTPIDYEKIAYKVSQIQKRKQRG